MKGDGLDRMMEGVARVKAGATPAEGYAHGIGADFFCPPIADKILTPELGTGIAGIVRTPGTDDVLEALESEADVVAANVELLEGRELSRAESERWQRLVNEIMRETNKRLDAKGIVLVAAQPEPNGLGFVMTGCNRDALSAAGAGLHGPSDDYTIVFTLPARERVDIARTSSERFVREAVDAICVECIEQQKKYRAQQGFFH